MLSKFLQPTIFEPEQFMTKTDMTIETEARTALPAITICLNSMHSRRTEKKYFFRNPSAEKLQIEKKILTKI